MSRRSIHVPNIGHKAPIPLGARVGNVICSSGIAGKDPATGALPAEGGVVPGRPLQRLAIVARQHQRQAEDQQQDAGELERSDA